MLAGTSGTPEVRAFSARRSDVDVTVRFQGGSVQCPSGPCTYVGVTHYTFRKRGPLALASAFFPQPGRPGMFLAYVQGRGHTSDEVDVLSSRGDAIAVCHDAVAHQFDGLGGELHRRRSLVTLHPFGSLISLGAPSGVPLDSGADYVSTHCPGPRDSDLASAHIVPSRSYATSRFRRARFSLTLAGTKPFAAGGFVGTVRFRVRFDLARQNSG